MERKIAKDLLDIEAVFLRPNEPFTWASGIKSPIYCDNRLTLSFPKVRTDIEDGLAELIKREYPECEAIFGTSTAGIAHAAIVADKMGLPMGYVRAKAKDHGRENLIEGKAVPGSKVVVIEDLISTAGSCVDVCENLRAAGCTFLVIASIFTYGMKKAEDRLKEHNLVNHSLSSLDTLVKVAAENDIIAESDIERVLKFRANPSDESWMAK